MNQTVFSPYRACARGRGRRKKYVFFSLFPPPSGLKGKKTEHENLYIGVACVQWYHGIATIGVLKVFTTIALVIETTLSSRQHLMHLVLPFDAVIKLFQQPTVDLVCSLIPRLSTLYYINCVVYAGFFLSFQHCL